ncbi:UNVERIFIED_CONTAM: KRUF family protein [Hammondia hammondi]|eukprot:XP_008888172.1 KRUF family protein [Hammondia hammondi]
MVTWLALISVAVAAISCSVEENVWNRANLCRIRVALDLFRSLWAPSSTFLFHDELYLRAFAARAPGDDDSDKEDRARHPLAVSERELEAAQALVALSSRSAIATSETQEETAASAAAAPPGGRGPTPGATDISPRSSRPAAKRKPVKDSGIKSSAPGGLGLARTVSLEGRGEVTYGQLAIEKLRRDAKDIREEWGCKDMYVKMIVGRRVLKKCAAVTRSQVTRMATEARNKHDRRSHAQLRQASELEALANRVATMLEAAGVDVSGSGGDSVSRPETTEGASRTDGDGLTPDVASDTSASGSSSGTYLQVGVNKLKKEAAALRKLAENKDLYIAQQVGVRVAQSTSIDPTDRRIAQWLAQARTRYYNSSQLWQQKAAELEALAGEREKQIAAGTLTPLGPVEGTSSSKKAIKEAAGPDSTAGRPVARGRGRRKQKPRDEGRASAVPPELLESSVPEAKAQMSSLRGTFFGSAIEVPGCDPITYVQLAIDKMRQEAESSEEKYRSAAAFIQDNLAWRMLQENDRDPPPETTRRWMKLAARRFSYRSCVSLQEAADLRRAADKLEKEAAAAGVLLRTSQEPTAPPSESAGRSQAAQTEGIAGGPHIPIPGERDVTFAHIAIAGLRRKAKKIRAIWCCGKKMYIAIQVALRMVRTRQLSPPENTLRVWITEARNRHSRRSDKKTKLAEQLEAQALALEQELNSLLSSARAHEAYPPPVTEETGESTPPLSTRFKLLMSECATDHVAFGSAIARPHCVGLSLQWRASTTSGQLCDGNGATNRFPHCHARTAARLRRVDFWTFIPAPECHFSESVGYGNCLGQYSSRYSYWLTTGGCEMS